MKKTFLAVLMVLLMALSLTAPAALARAKGNPQLRAAAKRQNKAMKKYMKAQHKTQRRSIKNSRKHTH